MDRDGKSFVDKEKLSSTVDRTVPWRNQLPHLSMKKRDSQKKNKKQGEI